MTIWMTNSRPGCSPEPQSAGEALLLAQVSGTVENGSNGGNLLLRFRSEVAGNAVTLARGSWWQVLLH